MTAGIHWDESPTEYTDPANNCAAMEGSDDWVQYVLDQPMAADPGKVRLQQRRHRASLLPDQEGDGQAGGRVRAGAPLRAARHRRLLLETNAEGPADTEGGLYLTPRDLAKIGYLYLHDGVWDGKRLLPEGWVTVSTPLVEATEAERSTATATSGGCFRTAPAATAYAALGYGGQLLIVVPEHELIAVFTGWNIYDKPSLDPGYALARVLAAIKARP